MQIILTKKDNLFCTALAATLTATYLDDFKLFDVSKKPVFDVFDEVRPDIIICHSSYVNNIFKQVFKEYSKTRVLIISENDKVDYEPDLYLSEEMDWANIAQYNNGVVKEEFCCDILYWSRVPSSKKLEKKIWEISRDYRLKSFGPYYVDSPYYLGRLSISDENNMLKSAHTNLDFNNYSKWDAVVNHCPNITDTTDLDQQKKIKLKLIDEVKFSKTYFHYLSKIFTDINLPEEAKRTLVKLQEFV